MSLYLRKLEFLIILVHFAYLFTRRCSKHFDDFNKLVDTAVTREYRLSKQ